MLTYRKSVAQAIIYARATEKAYFSDIWPEMPSKKLYAGSRECSKVGAIFSESSLSSIKHFINPTIQGMIYHSNPTSTRRLQRLIWLTTTFQGVLDYARLAHLTSPRTTYSLIPTKPKEHMNHKIGYVGS